MIFFLFNLYFIKISYSQDSKKDKIIANCLKKADAPTEKGYGINFKDLDVRSALKACKKAYKEFPQSIKVIRSLARAYSKDENNKEAIKLYKITVEQGDKLSQVNLGFMYYQGLGVEKNITEAIRLISLSANQGFLFAQNALAEIYLYGLGVKKNYGEALRLYKLASIQGSARAQTNLGYIYQHGLGLEKDYPEAIRLYKLAAVQGNANSQYNLARIYHLGQGVEKNYLEAMRLYKLASAQGQALAQHNLGMMYFNGEGVEKNYSEAIRFFKLGINLNEQASQFSLGSMYHHGLGVEKDYLEAIRLYKLAVAQGNPEAQTNLGMMYFGGLGVEKNYIQAIKLFKLAVAQDFELAQANLAYMYQHGLGLEIDYLEAIKLYTLASIQGSAIAQNNLGTIYQNGKGVEKNYFEALKFYNLAAVQGLGLAQNNLGHMYKLGLGVKKDLSKAITFFKKAADQGINDAFFVIDKLYNSKDFFKNNFKDYDKYRSTKENRIKQRADEENLPFLQFDLAIYYLRNKNLDLAIKYFNLSGNNGNLTSFTELGSIYHQGKHVPKDYKKAYEYYIKAGQETNALDKLGTLFEKGQGVKPDFQKAFEYYQKSIQLDKNNPIPHYHLGLMYFKGYGIPRNIIKSVQLFELSIEKGSPLAAEKLSEIYSLGVGSIKKDENRALRWLKKAKNINNDITEAQSGIIDAYLKEVISSKIINQKELIKRNKINNGKFYALMIGISKYDNFIELRTPLKDIKVLGDILKSQYNFNLKKLINPSKREIELALFNIEKKLSKEDSLLIYFAGHGELKIDEGYWIPKDAHEEDDSTWIHTSFITRKLNSIKANNILVIADSCYSGTMTRGIVKPSEIKLKPQSYHLQTKTRIAMSSGGVKPVLDGGGGGHSIFARMLINKLKGNSELLTSTQIYGSISKKVLEASTEKKYPQNPSIKFLTESGHEEADFVFIPN